MVVTSATSTYNDALSSNNKASQMGGWDTSLLCSYEVSACLSCSDTCWRAREVMVKAASDVNTPSRIHWLNMLSASAKAAISTSCKVMTTCVFIAFSMLLVAANNVTMHSHYVDCQVKSYSDNILLCGAPSNDRHHKNYYSHPLSPFGVGWVGRTY